MGIYGDILNKLDDSLYMKIEPGKPANIRLLDHPWISQKAFTDSETGEVSIRTQYHWPVWDYDQQRVRVMSQGKSVFKEIAKNCEKWPQGDQMPSIFDVIIERKGTGKYDTEYTVSAIPQRGSMPVLPSDQLPDMANASKGIPIQQVLEGKTAPVIGAGGDAPALPTHAQAEVLEAATSDHFVSEEEVEAATGPDGKINLDDIPF